MCRLIATWICLVHCSTQFVCTHPVDGAKRDDGVQNEPALWKGDFLEIGQKWSKQHNEEQH